MRKKVLIIDHDPDLLEIMEWFLKEEGFTVSVCAPEQDIHGIIHRYRPDIIMLDCIPHFDEESTGKMLCYQLKSNPKTRHIPVVAMSASAHRMEMFEDYAFDKFIAKPFDLNELSLQLNELVKINMHKYHRVGKWFNLFKLAS